MRLNVLTTHISADRPVNPLSTSALSLMSEIIWRSTEKNYKLGHNATQCVNNTHGQIGQLTH